MLGEGADGRGAALRAADVVQDEAVLGVVTEVADARAGGAVDGHRVAGRDLAGEAEHAHRGAVHHETGGRGVRERDHRGGGTTDEEQGVAALDDRAAGVAVGRVGQVDVATEEAEDRADART